MSSDFSSPSGFFLRFCSWRNSSRLSLVKKLEQKKVKLFLAQLDHKHQKTKVFSNSRLSNSPHTLWRSFTPTRNFQRWLKTLLELSKRKTDLIENANFLDVTCSTRILLTIIDDQNKFVKICLHLFSRQFNHDYRLSFQFILSGKNLKTHFKKSISTKY